MKRADSLPGADWTGEGVRFTLRAPEAEAVEVCLFDGAEPGRETGRISLERQTDGRWTAYEPGIDPGQLYGFRVHGPWEPETGLRFNSAKLLLDPFAGAISGETRWDPSLVDFDHWSREIALQSADTAPFVPRSVVVDRNFDWQDDQRPLIPWDESVIYECHVRGLTRLHPEIPVDLRGTYLGLCHESILEHLRRLGVTALELMPVQHFISEQHLQEMGLSNYFGYNPIGWIAPHAAYASGDRGHQVEEFKTMVRELHRAGFEVLLDVVFNHSAEGNHLGPVLSLRGTDNRAFYRLSENAPQYYENFSGCGNTLHFGHTAVIEFTLLCLRYWVEEMHVDGFRFDLAPIHGRDPLAFHPQARFFEGLRQDPVLGSVKLIAEPWDLGPDGYQLGRFPHPWRQWNDRYRDTVRAFWRGDRVPIGHLVHRLAGSADLLPPDPESSSMSVNFVTCHDGFTLQDLVSYEQRHNEANGEGNRDGHEHNLSRNWGVEGPTDSPAVQEMRERTKRNLIATLALSTGVPMLSHGDELGRTQLGNNNAYCHDSELTWVDWSAGLSNAEFLDFCQQIMAIRARLGIGRGPRHCWIAAHGGPLTELDLDRGPELPFGCLHESDRGAMLTLFNGDDRVHLFELPQREGGRWQIVLETGRPGTRRLPGLAIRLAPRSVVMLEHRPTTDSTSNPDRLR